MNNSDKDELATAQVNFFEKTTLPLGIEKKIQDIVWSVKDVLVGSLGSVKQLQDNLARNYYYVPEKYLLEKNSAIRYIALCQSKTMFGNKSGIRYYGEISLTKRVMRKEIDFPIHRNNAEEWYYAFKIKEWNKLPVPVSVQYETVFEPKFTNFFLLTNSNQSYELFSVNSAKEYILLHELKRMFTECSAGNNIQFETVRQIPNGKSIWIHDGYIDVIDENGTKLLYKTIKISDFSANPKKVFQTIAQVLDFN